MSAAPKLIQGSLQLKVRSASIVVSCGKSGPCQGVVQLLARKGAHGKLVKIATDSYRLAKGAKRRIVLRFVSRSVRVTAAMRKRLSLRITPKGGKARLIAVKVSSSGSPKTRAASEAVGSRP